MRTDKQLPDETRADDDTLSTEDIANANQRTDERAEFSDKPTEELTVTGTPVNGADAGDDRESHADMDTHTDTETRGDMDTHTDRAHEDSVPAPDDEPPPSVELLAASDAERFRTQWTEIQTRFVDDPRDAVQDADQLVAEVMRSLATTFTDHKHQLEGRWQEGDGVDTEELRQALRHYRSFFDHLLKV